MSVDELVEKFTASALAQDEAMLMDEHAKYNRLFNQMDVIGNELKSRAGDQRRALLPLHDHRNAQVRLTAAIATLAVAPDAARRVLQRISDWQEYPQAADARGMMRGLDDGTFRPT
jgi:hypothetical protein